MAVGAPANGSFMPRNPAGGQRPAWAGGMGGGMGRGIQANMGPGSMPQARPAIGMKPDMFGGGFTNARPAVMPQPRPAIGMDPGMPAREPGVIPANMGPQDGGMGLEERIRGRTPDQLMARWDRREDRGLNTPDQDMQQRMLAMAQDNANAARADMGPDPQMQAQRRAMRAMDQPMNGPAMSQFPPMRPGVPQMPPQAGPPQGAMDPNMMQFFSQFLRNGGGRGVR